MFIEFETLLFVFTLIKRIVLLCIPGVIMIALIPFISDDYLLALIYTGFIVATLALKKEKNDLLAAFFGFTIIIFFEFIFVSTGVEVFKRQTLFGMMPFWLPFLWAYGFILIKRGLVLIAKYK